MSGCNGITIGSVYNCQSPLKSRVNPRLLIGNLDDIEEVTYDPTETNVITNIQMKTGKQMFAFEGVRSSVKPQVDLVTSEVMVGFSHQVDFSVFQVDQAQKDNLQALATKDSFVIYENIKDTSLGDAIFEVMGVNSGLEMSTLQRMPNDGTSGGAYIVQLKTPESASETQLPNSFFDTDLETTETNIEALLTPAL